MLCVCEWPSWADTLCASEKRICEWFQWSLYSCGISVICTTCVQRIWSYACSVNNIRQGTEATITQQTDMLNNLVKQCNYECQRKWVTAIFALQLDLPWTALVYFYGHRKRLRFTGKSTVWDAIGHEGKQQHASNLYPIRIVECTRGRCTERGVPQGQTASQWDKLLFWWNTWQVWRTCLWPSSTPR